MKKIDSVGAIILRDGKPRPSLITASYGRGTPCAGSVSSSRGVAERRARAAFWQERARGATLHLPLGSVRRVRALRVARRECEVAFGGGRFPSRASGERACAFGRAHRPCAFGRAHSAQRGGPFTAARTPLGAELRHETNRARSRVCNSRVGSHLREGVLRQTPHSCFATFARLLNGQNRAGRRQTVSQPTPQRVSHPFALGK